MKTTVLKFTSILTAVAMLSGCANIKNDQTRTRAEGGLGGALLGGLIGYATGGVRGMAIGAAAGGAIGLVVGDSVARKKKKYATQELWLNACIAEAEQVNAHAVSYNNHLSGRISAMETRLASAKASGNKREIRDIKQAIVLMQKETDTEIGKVSSEIKEQNTVVSQTNNEGLRGRVSQLSSTQTSLSSSKQRLADLGNRADL